MHLKLGIIEFMLKLANMWSADKTKRLFKIIKIFFLRSWPILAVFSQPIDKQIVIIHVYNSYITLPKLYVKFNS